MDEVVAGPGLVVTLTEDDVPDASLAEPMEKQSLPTLKQWLLRRGIEMPSCTRKKQLLERLVGGTSEATSSCYAILSALFTASRM